MMKKFFFLILFLLSSLQVPQVFAQSNSYVSIVNPVRGNDSWELTNQKVATAVEGQINILDKFRLPATWLLRFDVLGERGIIQQLSNRSSDEKGIFLEVTPTWAKEAGVDYRQSNSWHNAGSAFLTGYEREERLKLIDKAFEKFKERFGSYPVSVGAWWIDSFSLNYMEKKYGIVSALIVADQYSTDNYQIWGQYFGTPYYPSKNNALHPAQSLENKLAVVITQWATRDPVNGYGSGVIESTFSVQANDYIDYHNLDINYFSKLIDTYTKQRFNSFSHLVVGLENSYEWNKYQSEYSKQIESLVGKRNFGQLSIVTLHDFANWYKKTFPNLSPAQIIVADDPLGSFKKAVWFMNPFYRVGWFYDSNGSSIRDIRQYIDGEEELCFKTRCDSVNFATSATRVLDDVSFGHKLILDQGKIKDFKVEEKDVGFVLSYINEAGNLRKIELLPRDIGIEGKISSIDATILNAVKQDSPVQKDNLTLDTKLNWSLVSVIIKLIKFCLFLVVVILIPGFILTSKLSAKNSPIPLKLFLSAVTGLAAFTLLFYVTSLLKIKPLIFGYILINLILFTRFYLSEARSLFKHINVSNKTINLILILVILAGTIFQVIPTFRSGLTFNFGTGFWGPNTHDGVWHMALINQLVKSVPPENPVFSSTILKNYHFFYDLMVAATSYLSKIPVADLLFRIYPLVFSLLVGVGSYYLIMRLFEEKLGTFKTKIAAIFSLYLIYFAGSFGWAVEFLRERHFGGESAFWVNQAVSFNLNPPFAISLVIMIAAIYLLFFSSSKGLKLIIVTSLLFGTVVSFKSYTGILMLGGLSVLAVLKLISKRNFSYSLMVVLSSLLAAWLFMSNFEATSSFIIWAPFWFIHAMVDSPDRVGWVRLSLARTSSQALGQWPKFILAEAFSLVLFIVGNLGVRFLSLGILFKAKEIFKNDALMFMVIVSAISVGIPILFIQSGTPWNTIQFFYPVLYISSIFSGVVIVYLIFKLNRVSAVLLAAIFLILAPINSVITAYGYFGKTPHAFIPIKELKGLEFLSSQPDGVVLTYPHDEKLRQILPEPWQILVYGSTAYVSALSGKTVYLEDEPQNQILLTDYKKRVVASNDFFLKPISENLKFLRENNIRYIYLPKIYNTKLDESEKQIRNIFENEEVVIYQIDK